ncbi:MAG: hypothetical protein AAGH88_06850 [Planctomycetota bacterium]
MGERKKKWVAFSLAIVAFVTLVVGGYQAWLRVAPPMPESVSDVEALLDNPRYQRLSDAEKRPYQERINEMWGGLSQEDQDRLRAYLDKNPDAQQEAADARQQMMRTMYVTRIIKQDEAGRDQSMDGFITMMDQNRQGQQRQGPDGEKTPEQQERESEGRRRMWEMLDKGDPQNLGYMSEFFKLMQQRREERGLPPL